MAHYKALIFIFVLVLAIVNLGHMADINLVSNEEGSINNYTSDDNAIQYIETAANLDSNFEPLNIWVFPIIIFIVSLSIIYILRGI